MNSPKIPFRTAVITAFLVTGLIACGGGEEETQTPQAPQPQQPDGGTTQPSVQDESAATSDCLLLDRCRRRCTMECASEEQDRTDYFAAQFAKIPGAPFKIRVDRAYLKGECHSGGDPARRRSVDGIAAVVEGSLTYTGDDLLYGAFLGGQMFLQYGPDEYREVQTAERSRNWWRRKLISRFTREVRGVDPWRTSESRYFHWESRPISAAFCESMPQKSQAYIELVTFGVKQGLEEHPVGFVNLNWDEVVGMAVDQAVSVKVRAKGGYTAEPAKAHYVKLDEVFVTKADNSKTWMDRDNVIQTSDMVKTGSTSFPVQLSTAEWRISVLGITTAREFGGYRPDGEDDFLAIVDVQMTYQASPGEGGEPPPAGKLRGTAFRLETSPGRWDRPVTKAGGQLDLSAELNAGQSVTGKVVFPRQRFERPFRIEVKTPDRTTAFMKVFDYNLGPEL